MKAGRIVALVFGALLALPAVALLVSGGALGLALVAQRDGDYFDVTLDRLESQSVAITAEQIDLRTEPGTPRWVLDALDTDVRLEVTAADGDQEAFIGIADERDVDQYLAGVAHDEIREVNDLAADFTSRSGDSSVEPPGDQNFWEASASGPGTQVLEWEAQSGQWAVALLNADGSPGVAADVNVGVRSDVLAPVAFALLAIGALLASVAAVLIILGGMGLGAEPSQPTGSPKSGLHPLMVPAPYPLVLEAQLEPQLSRWQWLVKWLLAIPHLLVLALLWAAFGLLTVVAGLAILFTGRYPRGIFDFNVGVLRWSWRVSYYAFSGGLGTDRYPPFSLGPEPDYPATLDVEYPEQLSRWLVLVKWWLLALPHYVIVALIAGLGFQWDSDVNWGTSGGLVGILTIVAVVILLFTGSYPRPLFDLIVGMNRWVYRVTAYVALMTDEYPPFRLDQGGAETGGPPDVQPPDEPIGQTIERPDQSPETVSSTA